MGDAACDKTGSTAGSREAALLLACLRARAVDTGELMPSGIPADVDWNIFLRLAIRHRMVPAVRHVLEPVAGSIPRPAWENIRDAALGIAAANERWMAELKYLLQELGRNNVPCMVLRGLPLSQQLYGNIHSRQISDLDILVHREDAVRAMAILSAAGYEPMFRLGEAQARAYVRFRIERTYLRTAKHMAVDLHWKAMPRVFELTAEEHLWSDSQPRDVEGGRVLAPDKEGSLLLIFAHGTKHGWDRFAQVLDLAMSLRDASAEEIRQAVDSASRQGYRRACLLGLALCRDLAGLNEPADLLEEATETPIVCQTSEQVKEWLLSSDEVWGRGGQERKLLRCVLEGVSAKARYYADEVLKPTGIEIEKVSLPRPLWFLYYFVRLMRLAIKAVKRMRAR